MQQSTRTTKYTRRLRANALKDWNSKAAKKMRNWLVLTVLISINQQIMRWRYLPIISVSNAKNLILEGENLARMQPRRTKVSSTWRSSYVRTAARSRLRTALNTGNNTLSLSADSVVLLPNGSAGETPISVRDVIRSSVKESTLASNRRASYRNA